MMAGRTGFDDDFERGIKQFRRQLGAAAGAAPAKMARALFIEAQRIMSASKPLVPVDTGVLRGSGTVNLPTIEGDDVVVDFGYGGAASAYAVVQHEALSYQHKVGQAKYLEEPFNAAAKGMAGRLAATLGKNPATAQGIFGAGRAGRRLR